MEETHGKTNIKVDDQCYFLKLEGNLRFEDVVGPDSLDNVTRKEFLVRAKDVLNFPHQADKLLKRIHKASGATIAIVSSPEVRFHRQAHMELWGTADQVEIAESAIVCEITKLYRKPFVPTILMQAPIYRTEVYVPVVQSSKLVGVALANVVKIEAESGAWIVVDAPGIPSPRHLSMTGLNIFGNQEQVYRALMIVNEAILEPYKPVDTEPSGTVQAAEEHKNVVLDHQALHSDEIMDDEAPKVEVHNEYDVFLKKLQSVKPMKTGIRGMKNAWVELAHKWPAPRSYRPTSPAYILTSHAELSPDFTSIRTSPPNPYDPKPPSYSPTPPSYSPTSPAYMFTSHVYIPSPPSNPYDPTSPSCSSREEKHKRMEEIHGKNNIKVDDPCYFVKLEGNLKFEDVVGPDSLDNVTRKEFLARLKDVLVFSHQADKTIKRIQKASGATIAIMSSPEVGFHSHARMELWGTADQVEIAESAIVREITKLYQNSFAPTILMQAPIYHTEVYVPVGQAIKLVGVTFENVVKIEAESGAWIVVDPLGIPSPHLPLRRLNIFGNRDQVFRALMIVNKAVLEPFKPVDTGPSGAVQAADEYKDMVLDHQLPVDSSDFVKVGGKGARP